MPDATLHNFTHFKAPKLDLSLTPSLADTFAIAAKAGRAYLSTVMLMGETGVGKTRIARHIHDSSPRAQKPFQLIDLSQATPSIFESEFFGHEKGSFTGASQLKKSPFELADGGTVFLDEIGTLSFELQARLLRLVQDKSFKRVGGIDDITVDVRILAATSLNLEEKVRKGEFREDLYHRLNVLQIYVPPLRERQADIIPLAEYFLAQASVSDRLPKKSLSDDTIKALQEHQWPGNVRALENEMKRATILTDGDVIEPKDLSFFQSASNVFALSASQSAMPYVYADIVEQLTRIGTIQTITEICDEAKRYLLEMSIFASAKDDAEYKHTKASEFLNCTPSSMGSYGQSLFKLENFKFSTLVNCLPAWRETRGEFPFADLAYSIAIAIVEENDKRPARKNMIKTSIEEDILHAARVEVVKAALIKHNFSQVDASKEIEQSDGYITWLIRRDDKFAAWLLENKTPRGVEVTLGAAPVPLAAP